jgi:hypothetical protein
MFKSSLKTIAGEFKLRKNIYVVVLCVTAVILLLCLFSFSTVSYDRKSFVANASSATSTIDKEIPKGPTPKYVATPTSVKGIYMSQCVVGTPSFRNKLVDMIDKTELNSVVIDIKDFSGTVGFKTHSPLLDYASMKNCGAPDMREFIETLHSKGIYVIGRITVFQDPYYTKAHPEQAVQSKSNGGPWKDHKGLSFIDVSSKPYWDVVVELSKEAHEIGFDELNYDYIRYPSDGNMTDATYVNPNPNDTQVNKSLAVETFFKYLNENVKPTGVVMSADLFGMTTVASDDLGIGQVIEKALPYFDYIMPMVYPSHFAQNFGGFGNPNTHVYDVIKYSMGEAVKRAEATSTKFAMIDASAVASTSPRLYNKPVFSKNKLRPWLQDFSYGGTYGVAEVKGQIKATNDLGLNSWILWDAGNKYTPSALGNEN